MKKTLVNSILNKIPIPDEIRETIGENVDFTKLIAREIMGQVMTHSGKIKDELSAIVAKEIASFLDRTDMQKILRDTLEEMEMDVKITFRRKHREKK